MGDIVNEGPGRPTRHAIAKVTHISSVVHHAGHVEVKIVFAGCEFSEEGGSSASSSSAARCIVQVGKRGFLHLVSVVPPQGKAPHSVTRHAATPEKSNKDPSCTSDQQFHLSRAAKSLVSVQKTPVAAVPSATEQAPVKVAMSSTL